MDYIIFVAGATCFGIGFVVLLLFLYLKKSLLFPFIFMGLGIVLCFVGLMTAQPLTGDSVTLSYLQKNEWIHAGSILNYEKD
ncbi:hypothetical protein [Natribacillus halophilus]|uniref:Uncharacterized protein n=1 Tax=Natribacillus halophilus TaxID=549003 RepID=A0A1G8JEI2_9BACI|nr:hypothetical protein [Natribacillus halophilus]SDI29606.1 hypothetical protein SAMN04488123_101188 [Natribacillus halophilus]